MTEWQLKIYAGTSASGWGRPLVKVGGAGVCHSDLHVMDYPAGALSYELPFTLGHENAGADRRARCRTGRAGIRLQRVGAGARRWARTIIVNTRRSPAADSDSTAACGQEAHMIVPRHASGAPLGYFDPREAAPRTDAGPTTYHAVKRSLPVLVPGSTAVVIGVGGLGQMAVQILKALSLARVVAVDTSADKLAVAKALAIVTSGSDADSISATAPQATAQNWCSTSSARTTRSRSPSACLDASGTSCSSSCGGSRSTI